MSAEAFEPWLARVTLLLEKLAPMARRQFEIASLLIGSAAAYLA